MFRSLAFAAVALTLVLAPAVANAATANGYNKFTISQNYDEAVAWYESHRDEVLKASNCRVLKHHDGGEFTAQTDTPIGACQYVLKETRQDKTDKEGRRVTIYRVTFVRNISGRVANQKVTIQLTEAGDKTTLQQWMTTTVAGRFVPVFAVSRVQQGSLAGCESYISKHAR